MKNWKFYAMVLFAAAAFTACDDDDDEIVENVTDETEETEDSTAVEEEATADSYGILIVNNGNQSSSIDGDFTTVDYSDNFAAYTGWFADVNERSLGLTSNAACIYGSQIYTAVTASNTIEICDKTTFESTCQISLDDDGTLSDPRDVVAYEGYVYVSLYSGHVCKIDTTDYSIVDYVEVGSYPEKMGIANGMLYVPNSGYGYGTSVSEIDLASFSATREITCPINPVQVKADANENVYILSSGEYDSSTWEQIGAGVYILDTDNETYELVTDATLMDIPAGTNTLYVVNAPYLGDYVSYGKVDLTDDAYELETLDISADSPAGIAVDPVYGYIVLSSYELGDYGYASYSTPGYANIYDSSCSLLTTIETGVGPCAIYFYAE